MSKNEVNFEGLSDFLMVSAFFIMIQRQGMQRQGEGYSLQWRLRLHS